MRLNNGIHLAYCTNIHRGRDWVETFNSLKENVLDIPVNDKGKPSYKLENIAKSLIETTELAGKKSIEIHKKGLKIITKPDNSPVTNGDLEVNKILTERIKILKESNDGFWISEEDMKLRGYGDLLGFKQSGAQSFRLADPIINEDLFEQYLTTNNVPDPELLIRTGGEYRISNLLLWQIAYSELFFTDTLWPDFRRNNLKDAILDYH